MRSTASKQPRYRRVARRGQSVEILALEPGDRVLECTDGCGLLVVASADDEVEREVWRLDPEGHWLPLVATVSRAFGRGQEARGRRT